VTALVAYAVFAAAVARLERPHRAPPDGAA
jgi:hypothetical protein